MSIRELKIIIDEKSEEIAKIMYKGYDCEIRTYHDSVAVIKVKKYEGSK